MVRATSLLLLLLPQVALAVPKALVVRNTVWFWSAGCPNPSGGATEQELEDQGVAYDSVNAATFSTANLYDYTMIFLPDCQNDPTYNAWNARVADLDAWVSDGGFLAVHAVRGECSESTVQPTIPGGTPTRIAAGAQTGTVLNVAHPIVAGLPNPATGNGLAHDAFPTTGNAADIELIENPDTGNTLLFERPWGYGTIIYGGLTYECYQATCGSCGVGDSGTVLANEVAHGSTFEVCSDPDTDGDGASDACDVRPSVADPDQLDADGDGFGDACDLCATGDDALDADGDAVPDACDVCEGGADDEDADGDGVPDLCDICPVGDDLTDTDGDTRPDACDVCPEDPDPQQQDGDGDGAGRACDCDDEDPAVSPLVPELCNGIDDDCDGEIDDPSSADATDWYADGDGDGFGDGPAVRDCETLAGHVEIDGDCDDADPAVHPDAEEVCNGIDDDCDDEIDPDCEGEALLRPGEYVEFGCHCASGGPGGGWLAGLVVALAVSRRRGARG